MNPNLSTMRDYARLLFRRKIALFVPILISAVLIVPLWLVTPPRYQATAIVKRQNLALARSTSSALMSRGAERVPLRALRVEVLTWTNLKRVIEQLKMDADLKTPADWQRMYDYLRKGITIRSAAEGRGVEIVEIAATSSWPVEAAQVANAIADNYVEENKERSRRDSSVAVKFHGDGEAESLEKLRETELELDKYRQKHFTDLPEVKSSILAQRQSLLTNETAHSLLLIAARTKLAEIDKQLQEVPKLVEAETVREENPRAVEVEDQLAQRKRLLEVLLLNCTEEHPQILSLRTEIAALEKQSEETPPHVEGSKTEAINPVFQQLVMDHLATRQTIREHEAALEEIQAEIIARNNEIQKVVKEEKRYTDLLRLQSEYQETYDVYRRNLRSATGRYKAEVKEYGTEVEMLARALTPIRPTYPLKMAAACIAAGIAAGLALMFSLEFCDQSLRSVEDAAAFLDVTILGSVSSIITPEEMKSGRRRRYFIIGVLVALLAVLSILFVVLQPL